MRRVLLAVLLTSSGCLCGPSVCMATGATPAASAFGIAGSPLTVRLALPIMCPEGREPTGLVSSVLDPSNASLAHDAGAPQAVDGYSSDLSFTPREPGVYHVTVRFEPNVGVAQLEVMAAVDRRDAGSAITSTQTCARYDVTPLGAVVCHGTAGGLSIDGQDWEAPAAHAAGTIWALDGTHATRWSEAADGGFIQTATSPFLEHLLGYSMILPGAGDALYVAQDGSLVQVTPETDAGASIATWASVGFSTVLLSTPWAIWRGGERDELLMTLSPSSSMTGWSVSALDAGTRPPSSIATATLTVVGCDRSGIWAIDTPGTGPQQLVHFAPQGIDTLLLPPGYDAPTFTRTAPAPWDTGVVLKSDGGVQPMVAGFENGAIQLEYYGERAASATSGWAAVSTGVGAQLFPRP